ncbi:hypothetical protein C6P40_004905 [Pichia californica]|uniref:Major facilitator superfamily (MFS) profile domain-containing protein n=1 Tax=Pichia californica TaxID=460514 RepID=A0A9P6WNU2_9ASCO|nr:hypothetical protein C6P42_000274 [[Candida] californica]KAG0689527.1 hypothetical protein C6P40_004905 [[Candida] californica]
MNNDNSVEVDSNEDFIKSSEQLDETTNSLSNQQDLTELFPDDYIPTEEEMDKIYQHLDFRIIPACWTLYFLASYGSSAYGNTLTMNSAAGHSLSQSLNLTTHDKSTATALYYVAYIIFDLPMNLIMTRASPQVWLSRIITGVGIVYICYAALTNGSGLMAIRFMTGFADAGTWPGLSYYISLWYPEHRIARRVGYYFTAAQLSASAAGLVAAGFQKMDMDRGLYGWKWYYIVYGAVTIVVGISLIWWLPDRPGYLKTKDSSIFSLRKFIPENIMKYFTPRQPLNDKERRLHYLDMRYRYKNTRWGLKDVGIILLDYRTWSLIMMYFGVVGTGFGLAVFATTLIQVEHPSLSGIDVSLLYAPIWLFDLAAIIIFTPIADKFKKFRHVIFCFSTMIIITGLLVTSYAHGPWNRYAGLLIAGFGLGPTVPITMTLATQIMAYRYGDVGCAASAAIISGLGNLGTVVATYALYTGWPADVERLFRDSNMMLIVMLGVSIISAIICWFIMERIDKGVYDNKAKEIEKDFERHVNTAQYSTSSQNSVSLEADSIKNRV